MSFTFSYSIPIRIKRLWVQVMRRAIFDYVLYKGVGSRRRQWKSAFNYIFIENRTYDDLPDGDPAFGFEEVCSLFSWDPDYIRRLTVKLTRADIKRLEISSFGEEFDPETLESIVRKSGSWKSMKTALPFYPRMLDEFSPMPQTAVVYRETISSKAPIVQWRVAI